MMNVNLYITQRAALRYAFERAQRDQQAQNVWFNGTRYAVVPDGEYPIRPEGENDYTKFAGPIEKEAR